MDKEIVGKLNRHITAGIEREADVLYVMAEIRKLFEHSGQRNKYPVLAFYSNWVLHTKLDREEWVSVGLKSVDDAVVQFHKSGDGKGILHAVDSTLPFQRLHDEMLAFGNARGITFSILSNNQWKKFGELLIDILVDTPLQTRATLQEVVELSLTRQFSFAAPGRNALAFWMIKLSDGTDFAGPIF